VTVERETVEKMDAVVSASLVPPYEPQNVVCQIYCSSLLPPPLPVFPSTFFVALILIISFPLSPFYGTLPFAVVDPFRYIFASPKKR